MLLQTGIGGAPRLTRVDTLRHVRRPRAPRVLNSPEELVTIVPHDASLLKPILFTVVGTGVIFGGAAIWQYERMRVAALRQRQPYAHVHRKKPEFRAKFGEFFNQLPTEKKVVYSIIAVNVGVFACWRVPALRNVMNTYFVCSPFGKAPCLSMLGSTFSHTGGVHLFVNMFVLSSFIPPVLNVMGLEQTVACYLSAGLVSSLASQVVKYVQRSPTPSVGASGAILGMLGVTCLAFPDSRLSFAFIDQLIPHSFTAKQGLIGLLIFDTLGLVLRWRVFDHAGHLGGVLFGLFYATYGHKWIWNNRTPVLDAWHKVRGGAS